MANTLKFGNGEWYGKKDTILAYNDLNSNYKPLPFNFSRASKATVINKDGLIEEVGSGQPRVDYKDDTKGALLLEPSRTNLITHSDAIQSVGFSGVGTSIQADVNISPDGTTNADLHKENTANGNHFMFKDFNLSSGQTYSISVFAKSNGVNRNLRFGDGGVGWSSGFNVNFDLTNGTASSGGIIESYGNGWYRCSVVGTTSATTSRLIVYNILNTSTSYQGDGSSGVFLYGLQIEAGSYPTSYIATSGSAVTRLADSCSQTVPDGVIGQTEGTMYAEYYFDATIDNSGGSDRDVVSISANSSNIIKIVHFGNGTASYNKKVYFVAIVGGSYVVTIISGQYSSGLMKVAAAYKNNDYVLYVNGVQIGTDSNAGVPACSVFALGKYFSAIPTPTPINETKLYNTRLSNAELATLTQV